MSTLPAHTLASLVEGVELVLLTNRAWIQQAEQHNKASHNLVGARERTPVLVGTLFWLERLAALSAAVDGDEARVAALLDRALEKATSEAAS